MKIEIFSVCDAATEGMGKLNILGAFDTIYTKTTPTVHPTCALALRVRFESVEEGEHPFRILMIDQDGLKLLGPVDGKIGITIPAGINSVSANLVVNFQQLPIRSFGQYRIDLSIDNQLLGSIPLFVRQIK